MTVFNLPDLGEGLPDAEIVEWFVKPGDTIEKDQPLVSMETAKAIVDIPSPYSGSVSKLFGGAGDIIETGQPLVEFDTGETQATPPAAAQDAGTVVGEVEARDEVVNEKASRVGNKGPGVKATPAVRALARRLDVQLSTVSPSGPNGTVTAADVQRVAKRLGELGPLEPLRGVRRAMARSMSQAHAEVVPATVFDDADIDTWPESQNTTIRLARAIVAGCRAEPALNAWYDSHSTGRRLLKKIDLGLAVDTGEGLFVPVLRNIADRDETDLLAGLETMKRDVRARKVPPEEMRGYSIMLSNFGAIGGRYAAPVVVPPAVAIIGAGKARAQPVAVGNEVVVHKVLPLSLTFDHRAVTGGEATRFLKMLVADLESPE
ncbi:MAG: dihydrolipoamide acetyltransferase family protein [Gammaproteobacteria bacterium]